MNRRAKYQSFEKEPETQNFSLNDFLRPHEHDWWNRHAKSFGGLKINTQHQLSIFPCYCLLPPACCLTESLYSPPRAIRLQSDDRLILLPKG